MVGEGVDGRELRPTDGIKPHFYLRSLGGRESKGS